MATKWKNKGLFAVAVLLFIYGLNALSLLLHEGYRFVGQSYFDTQEYQNYRDTFIGHLRLYVLSGKSESEWINAIREKDPYQADVKNTQKKYQSLIDKAKAKGDEKTANALKKELEKKISVLDRQFSNALEEFKSDYERKKMLFYNEERAFKYRIKDMNTGQVYTNLPEDKNIRDVTRRYQTFHPIPEEAFHKDDRMMSDIAMGSAAYEGEIGLSRHAPSDSAVMIGYRDFLKDQRRFYFTTLTGLIALAAGIVLFIKRPLSVASGPWTARLPFDVVLAGAVYATLFVWDVFRVWGSPRDFISLILEAVKVSAAYILWTMAIERWRKGTPERLLRQSVTYRFWRVCRDLFLSRSIALQTLILLFVVFVAGMLAWPILGDPSLVFVFGPVELVLGLPALYAILKRSAAISRLVEHTNHLAAGFMLPDLPARGRSPFARLEANINRLKHGVVISQEKEAKSERLKTELITNVSHDLRTPLTSIMTYAELLKQQDLGDEKSREYVEIITRKAKRLKVLIDDLFEVSKMASGAVELQKRRVDLVQLLHQAIAENEERIAQSGLTFRVKAPEQPIYAMVDGQKCWRVFDNLIGNILKYSLENTRVYIHAEVKGQDAVFTFKNITKYELNDDVDELFERFKRGEPSRHTEGSGLGLAIAKSIVDLHGGGLDIAVDGDLFKVTVTFPLAH